MDPYMQNWLSGLAGACNQLGAVLQWCPKCKGSRGEATCDRCAAVEASLHAVRVAREVGITQAQREVRGDGILIPNPTMPGR
jgi:hypothetical protein